MKAFILDRYESADPVRAGEMPDPELREDAVLVQIHAAGVNSDLIIYPDSGHVAVFQFHTNFVPNALAFPAR